MAVKTLSPGAALVYGVRQWRRPRGSRPAATENQAMKRAKTAAVAGTRPAYLDPDAPTDARVRDLLSRLTLAEKASQMRHESAAIPRLGIPRYDWWSEGLHGVARQGVATVFPQAIGLGATFDANLLRRVGSAISDEARAKFHARPAIERGRRYQGLTYWSPNINIFRDPRWGRGQETYGEDPFLTGLLGAAFVRGLQGDHPRYLKIAACAKHYAVHSGPEKDRHHFDARVSPKDLHETYLPAFKALVDAGVESVMGAYNRTNGEPCCGSRRLLVDILRGAWGFKGHVVSDCWAIRDFHTSHKVTKSPEESAALAVRMGCDVNCGCTYESILPAVEQGLLTEADIDACLARLLRTRFRLGMFDPDRRVPHTRLRPSVVDRPKHRALAREAAAKSIVLLKNRDGILPLAPERRNLYVTGPNAATLTPLLGNYYGVNGRMVTPLEGIVARSRERGLTVNYNPGCLLDRPNVNPMDWSSGEAARADAVVAVMGLSPLLEGEEGESIASATMGDRVDIGLPAGQLAYLRKLRAHPTPLIVVLATGSPLAVQEAHDLADAVLVMWYPGEEGGNALADVLFGDVSPSGRLPVTFPRSLEQLPPFEDYAMAGRTYRYMTDEPLYPFGFGLGYGEIAYSRPRLSARRIEAGQSVRAGCVVTNRGARATEEVVQLYLADLEASVPGPRCELKAVRRVALRPGASRTIAFTITPAMMEMVGADGDRRVEPGAFRVTIGGGSPGPRGLALGAPAPVEATFEVR